MDFWVDVDCKPSLVPSMVLILQKYPQELTKMFTSTGKVSTQWCYKLFAIIACYLQTFVGYPGSTHDVRVLKNYDLYDRVGECVDLMFVS